jgi:hypothetical protein
MLHAGERSKLEVEAPDGMRAAIVWSDSDAYRTAESRLAIKGVDAVGLARKSNATAVDAAGVQAVPNFLVGDWYHVESDHVIGQAALGGWYVNGNDGRTIFRSDHRVIRFDVFDGDKIVMSPE